uniref:Uncharacterized protein n=1 Tax=Rhizophora mucronata TaxID=61149 RepID=A0A2P2PG29_RHIMU
MVEVAFLLLCLYFVKSNFLSTMIK